MPYVIAEPCIGVKDASCVEVCPVDCIHPTAEEPGFDEADQLYIDPEECIDCDACVEACPVDAITSEDLVPPEWQDYIKRNAAYYRDGSLTTPSPSLISPAASSAARPMAPGSGRGGSAL